MSGEIVKEWYFWLVSVAAGAFMAFVYDVVRLFRRLIRHGRFAVDFEDILYWTACFGLSFTLLYYGNNGVIRFAAVLGAAVGMALYAVTVGRFFVRVSFFIIDKTVGALFRLIRRIVKSILRFLKKWYHKWQSLLKRIMKRISQKIQLTRAAKRHKIKVHKRKATEDGKGEMTHGEKGGKGKSKRTKSGRESGREAGRKKQPGDAGISSRQE